MITEQTTKVNEQKLDARAATVLRVLAQTPDLSQRELAHQAGLSLTKAHFLLRELRSKGLIQIMSSNHSAHRFGYVYDLTADGRRLCTQLDYQALNSAVEQFKGVLGRLRATLSDLLARGEREVALLGEGPLSEAASEYISRDGRLNVVGIHEATVVVVCDPEAEESYRGQARLVRLTTVARRV